MVKQIIIYLRLERLRYCYFAHDLTTMHILMADDDKDDFYILQQAAKKTSEPLKISYVANWIELWRFLIKTLPDVLFPDLSWYDKKNLFYGQGSFTINSAKRRVCYYLAADPVKRE